MQVHIGAWATALDEDGVLWLSNFNYNGLYKYDFKMREMSYVHKFEDMGLDKPKLHREMYVQGSEIFLLPLSDNKIRIYNKKTHIEERIDIPNSQGEEYNTCILGNKALIFSCNSTRDIIFFHFAKKTLEIESKLSSLCVELVGKKDATIMKGSCGKNLFLLNEDTKILYCIDIDSYEYRAIDVGYVKESITRVFFYNNKYWFLLGDSCDIYASDGRPDFLY